MKALAVDVSGSTFRCDPYYDYVQMLYEKLESTEGLHLFLWNHTVQEVDPAAFLDVVKRRAGEGGTELTPLVDKLLKTQIRHLILVTDGAICKVEVDKVEALLVQAGATFERVDAHLLHTGYGHLDLTVVAPFLRQTEYEIHVRDVEESKQAMMETSTYRGTSTEEVHVESITTLEDLRSVYDGLFASIMGRNLGRLNEQLRTRLLEMQSRIFRNRKAPVVDALVDAFIQGQTCEALHVHLGPLLKEVYCTASLEIAEVKDRIARLLELCSRPGHYDLSTLSTNSRFQRARQAETRDEIPLPPLEQEDYNFECPVMLDADVPVLLVARPDRPVLEGLAPEVLERIFNCPLFALQVPEVIDRIRAALDCPFGAHFLREYENVNDEGWPKTSPMTRRPLLGGLFFGNDEANVRETNWTLAHLLSGGKLVGQSDLWWLVVWKIASQTERFASNEALMRNFREHMVWRMRTRTTALGLSGHPEHPQCKVPLGLAVWYALESTAVWVGTEHEGQRERLRELWPVADVLLEVAAACDIPVDAPGAAVRARHLRALSYMIRAANEDVKSLRTLLRAQYQNWIDLADGGPPLFLDGPSSTPVPNLPAALAGLPSETVVALGDIVLAHLYTRIGSIHLPITLPECRLADRVEWNYSTEENDPARQKQTVPICPATLRPYMAPKGFSSWRESARAMCGDIHRQLSMQHHYETFLASQRRYPEDHPEEFLRYCARREAGREFYPHTTLPASVLTMCAALFEDMDIAYRARFGSRPRECEVVCSILRDSMDLQRRKTLERT